MVQKGGAPIDSGQNHLQKNILQCFYALVLRPLLLCETTYWLFALGSPTYVVAACRLDSLMSVVFLEGESSSTGEMKPSPSSSMWSRKLSTLRSGRTLTVNCVFVSPSSSEPSSSSCPEHRRGQMMSKGGGAV